MSVREVSPGWIVNTYEGQFAPAAHRTDWDVSLDVNDDDTITIEHEVPGEHYGSTVTARVTVPIVWVTQMVAATLAYRARKVKP